MSEKKKKLKSTQALIKPPLSSGDLPSYAYMGVGSFTPKATTITTRTTVPEAIPYEQAMRLTDGTQQVSFLIERYRELQTELTTNTQQLLHMLQIKLSELPENKTTVTLHLDEYMQIKNIPHSRSSRNKFRTQIRKDMDVLYRSSIEWKAKDPETRKMHTYGKMRIITKYEYGNNVFTVVINSEIAPHLRRYGMQYPISLQRIDGRNRNAYPLGLKLANHYSIVNNRKKGSHNCLKVTTLLRNLPGIPTEKEVAAYRGSYMQKIVKPFEDALDAAIDNWEYCNAKREPLSEAQLHQDGSGETLAPDYDTFKELYITFSFKDHPSDLQDALGATEKQAGKRRT